MKGRVGGRSRPDLAGPQRVSRASYPTAGSRYTNSAVPFALGTTFTWGLWLVLADLASDAVDPVVAAAITSVVAAAIGVLVLGEPPSPTRVAGIGLAVVPIVLISRCGGSTSRSKISAEVFSY